jgi:hypothetical protein
MKCSYLIGTVLLIAFLASCNSPSEQPNAPLIVATTVPSPVTRWYVVAGEGASPPSSGLGYKVGDMWKNTAPAIGKPYFWECVIPPNITAANYCVWVPGPNLGARK